MAVTHADLAPKRRGAELGSKTGAVLMVISILFGLLCFVLCLIAESTRSQVIREANNGDGGDRRSECRYSDNGKMPLLCASGAFLSLAIAMIVEHTYMLLAVSKSNLDQAFLTSSDPMSNDHLDNLTWQAAFFFVTTWICFSVGEVLLLIGLSVESGHLKNWSMPRRSCLIIREGLFSSAGVLGITTVFLASGLYITALRAQWLFQDREHVRQEVFEASTLYSSPPRSPPNQIIAISNENPITRHNLNYEPALIEYLRAFDKII